MIKLEGYNSFYRGWLHGVFGLEKVAPDDEKDKEGWLLGFDTAIETGSRYCFYALYLELVEPKEKHIFVVKERIEE